MFRLNSWISLRSNSSTQARYRLSSLTEEVSQVTPPPQGTPPSKVNDFASQDNWGRAALDTNPRATVSLPGDTFH